MRVCLLHNESSILKTGITFITWCKFGKVEHMFICTKVLLQHRNATKYMVTRVYSGFACHPCGRSIILIMVVRKNSWIHHCVPLYIPRGTEKINTCSNNSVVIVCSWKNSDDNWLAPLFQPLPNCDISIWPIPCYIIIHQLTIFRFIERLMVHCVYWDTYTMTTNLYRRYFFNGWI